MSEMCAYCGASFSGPADLVGHVKTAHHGGDAAASLQSNPAATTPGFECELCRKVFPTAEALARHNLTRPERRQRDALARGQPVLS